jgi:hypothetical protein
MGGSGGTVSQQWGNSYVNDRKRGNSYLVGRLEKLLSDRKTVTERGSNRKRRKYLAENK